MLEKRSREPVVIPTQPPPLADSRAASRSNTGLAMDNSVEETTESQIGAMKRPLGHDTVHDEATSTATCSVEERPHKRRNVRVVHVWREIKEEEPDSVSLSGSTIDTPEGTGSPLSPHEARPRETVDSVSAQCPTEPRCAQSAETQQPTPPSSPSGSDTSRTSSSSGPPPTLPPTPPDSPRLDIPEPFLEFPEKITDVETYRLAAASSQALFDHYMRLFDSAAMSISPPSDD
ncbi:hypothetical protein DFH06DRAFT_1208448 [Mycena polygramma]|nr:hypothetical protein DFH06DRAFT_1208448 [Mycena polygramma]